VSNPPEVFFKFQPTLPTRGFITFSRRGDYKKQVYKKGGESSFFTPFLFALVVPILRENEIFQCARAGLLTF
jgi:hypothetical protein